ncbi:hypothetical protein, partial [Nakamurella sp.]|uniref:hypothetical protein n=1 Tax=Nakamurella sp. TaxID=1869182 RepID=UPI003B3A7150
MTGAGGVDRHQSAGDLPLTATDAGNRPVDLLGPDGPVQVVPAPADLRLTDPSAIEQPVAGGSGRITFTAANAGGRPTVPTGIDVTGTDGVSLAASATGTVSCDAPAGRCTLPAIAPGGQVIVSLTISATPATTTGTVTVTPDGGPAGPRFTVLAGPGITALTTPTGQLVADGAARTVPVAAALAPTVTTPGPVTVTSGSPAVRLSCGGATAAGTATCTPGAGNGFDLVVVVDPDQAPGPLPITAADAGARPLNLRGPDGPVQVVPAPADLTLALGTVVPPAAGGQGSVTVTIANTGGLPSGADRSLGLSLPAGLTPGSATPGVDCAGTTCTLPPVGPGASLIVTVTLAADPGATDGLAEITLGEAGTGPFPIPVRAGVTALSVPAGTLLADGRPQTVPVTATPAAGVTDLGAITVTAPDGIDLACPDTGTAGPTVTCDLGTGTTVPLTITPATGAPLGPIALTARDAGGRTIPDDFRGLVVRSPARLDLGPVVLVRPLVAGGGGAVALTVTNSGGVESAPAALTLPAPAGVAISGVTVDGDGAAGRVADGPGPAWSVGALAPGASVTLTVDLTVDPTVPADAELRLAVGDTESDALAVSVAAGIDRLVVDPDGPVVADGRPSDRTVTVEAADGIDPGEVTLVAGGGITITGPNGCPSDADETRVTCGDRRFTVAITAPPGTAAGPLPLTATDAGGRPLTLTALTVAAPATLDFVGDAEIVAPPVAGGTGAVRFTVTNSGGVASADGVPVRAAGTEGLTPTAVECSAGAVAPAVAAGDPAGCVLPPIDPGGTATVELTVRATPAVTAGTVTVRLPDASRSADLTVGPGLAVLSASTTSSVVADGTPTPITLVATPTDDTVTEYGPVTVDTGTDRVTIACGGTAGPRVTCDLGRGTVPLVLRVAPGTTGPLAVTATDAAGRTVPTTFDTLVVLRPSALALSGWQAGPLVAGTGGTAALTVTNTGDVPTSAGLPIAIAATDAAGGDLDPALLRLVGVTPADAVTCTDQGCALRPLAPGTPVTLTLDLAAAITLPGDRVGITVGVGAVTAGPALAEVRSAVRGVTIDPAGPLYPDGRPVTRTVTVSSDGPDPAVTFLPDGGVTLAGPACPAGTEPGRLTCT